MNPKVAEIVGAETPTKELNDLFQKIKNLVKMSRQTMSRQYPVWDAADRTYRGERYVDTADKKALARGEPAKVIVPMSYTQVQTFTSFMVGLFTQRDYVFEIDGTGIEDAKPAKLSQATLERDLVYNKFRGVLLPQWCTDIGRFGLGIFKTDWTRVTVPIQVDKPAPSFSPTPGMPSQIQPPMVKVWEQKTKYLGNRISVINPYRWFPDTRLPITRYRDGEFCADEAEYSKADLMKMETEGQVAGIKFVPKVPPAQDFDAENRRSPVITKEYILNQPDTLDRYILITEVQIRLNPSKTKIAEDTVIDDTIDQELVYFIWIANDSRIVKIVDSGYDHNEFLYDASQFFNDQTRQLNFGISEFLGPSQDVMDWLMNSRITNVRKVIQNQLVVDPRYIEMQDLKDRNPVLRLKSTAPTGLSIQTYLQQLSVTDVTTGHVMDMQNVAGFAKEATGINENLLGQYSEGRRSAAQTNAVMSAGAQRLIVVAAGMWESGILPMGQKMLCNLRQGLDAEQLVSIIGLQKFIESAQPDQLGQIPVNNFLPVDKSSLVGNYDFRVFDATLPSQRMATAAALQELLIALAKDPRLVIALGYDPKLILDEVLELRNVRNPERFRVTPQRANELMLMAGLAGNQTVASGTGGPSSGNTTNGRPPASQPQGNGGQSVGGQGVPTRAASRG